jgi:glycerol-3-phosphate acyltransferase PlsY
MAVLAPFAGLACLGVAAVILLATRYVSLMSIISTAGAGVLMAIGYVAGWTPPAALIFTLVAGGLIQYMHIPNMRRLLAGTEPRIGHGGDRRATG